MTAEEFGCTGNMNEVLACMRSVYICNLILNENFNSRTQDASALAVRGLDLLDNFVIEEFASPPKLNPQIDGTFVKYSVADSIRLGKLRPQTGTVLRALNLSG